MTVAISVIPDENGIVRITCDGADMELHVGPQVVPAPGPKPSGVNPIDEPILSLRAPSATPQRPLLIRADTIDIHAIRALVLEHRKDAPAGAAPRLIVDLRRAGARE